MVFVNTCLSLVSPKPPAPSHSRNGPRPSDHGPPKTGYVTAAAQSKGGGRIGVASWCFSFPFPLTQSDRGRLENRKRGVQPFHWLAARRVSKLRFGGCLWQIHKRWPSVFLPPPSLFIVGTRVSLGILTSDPFFSFPCPVLAL